MDLVGPLGLRDIGLNVPQLVSVPLLAEADLERSHPRGAWGSGDQGVYVELVEAQPDAMAGYPCI